MKKICLVVVGLYLQLLSAFSQPSDSSQYKPRRLRVDEINMVYCYYNQNGDHSAIIGDTGTQKLADYVTDLDVVFTKYNKKNNKVDLDIDVGIEYYTSSSSDSIDPKTVSSASSHDIHFYPSVTRSVTNDRKGTEFDFGASIGTESYYLSSGYTAGFSKTSKDKNRQFSINAKCYLDIMKKILPVELRTLETGGLPEAPNYHDYPWVHRNSFSALFSLSQVMNKRWQLLFATELAYQQGFLSLPFHRIYFDNGTEGIESLPSHRFKLPASIRSSYFLGDKFVIRSFYRFYIDDWGLNAHTIDNEVAYKVTPFFSVAPFYRFYIQNAINYFQPYKVASPTEEYYSVDYDLSSFHSSFFGTGIRIAPPKGIFGDQRWNMIEIRYGHYIRSNDFHADVISMNLKFGGW